MTGGTRLRMHLRGAASTLTWLLIATSLSACGGGGSGTVDTEPAATTNDDPVPELSLSDTSVTEGTAKTITVLLSQPSNERISFDIEASGGTAELGVDFPAFSVRGEIPAGDTSAEFSISTTQDNVDETNETFNLVLSNVQNADPVSNNATITILDEDLPPTLVITGGTSPEGDLGSSAEFVVNLSLSAESAKQVSVAYFTQEQTATAGADFTAVSGSIDILPGETNASVPVTILGDDVFEGDETFFLVIASSTNATPAAQSAAVTIQEDDADTTGTPQLSISNATVSEGSDASLVLTLSDPVAEDVIVRYSTTPGTAQASADFSSISNAEVTFAVGSQSQTITISSIDDQIDEPQEFFNVDLTLVSGNAQIINSSAQVYLDDNDPQPALSVANMAIAEPTGTQQTYELLVSLDQASAFPITFEYMTAGTTATSGDDYIDSLGEATIPAGATSASIELLVFADNIAETDEALSLVISNAGNATIANGSAVITILDDDAVEPQITVDDVLVSEQEASVEFQVSLSASSSQPVTVDYSTLDGSAEAGEDYVASSGTATIAAGELSTSIAIAIVDDTTPESSETFSLALSNSTGAILSDTSATATITDNDTAIQIGIGDASVVEGDVNDVTLRFPVSLSAPSSQPISFEYATADQSAIQGSDYVFATGTTTLPPNVTVAEISVTVLGDTVAESAETLLLLLSNPLGATLLNNQAQGSILDNEGEPALSISDASANENSGQLNFNVIMSPASSIVVSVDFASTAVTAQSGADYQDVAGTLTFAVGETAKTIQIVVNDDLADEPDELLSLTLSNSTVNIVDAVASGLIVDDDASPQISIADQSADEGQNVAPLVQVSAISGRTISVSYTTQNGTAVAGQDFASTAGELVFPPGVTAQTINVDLFDDLIDEVDENLTVVLSNPTNASVLDASGNITILDNDGEPTISASNASISEGSNTVAVSIDLSAASGKTITADFTTQDGTAVAGADYVSVTGTATLNPGQVSQIVNVSLTDDDVSEPQESFALTLSNVTNSTPGSNATITITDDDPQPTISVLDNTVVEEDVGASQVDVSVTMSNASSSTVTVEYATANGTAIAGSDYTSATGTLTFAANETLKSIAIDVLGDATEEPTETFTVDLSNPTGAILADASATITVSDNDGSQGLASRPSNTTCLAPARTNASESLGIVEAFPSLPGLSYPLKLLQAPGDSSMFYATERSGSVVRFAADPNADTIETYLNVGVSTTGEGGLLGLAFDPAWPSRKHIYVSYTINSGGFKSRLSRLIVTDDATLPATYTEQVLMTIDQPATNHNGGEVAFDSNNLLYWGIGDGGGANDPSNHSQNTQNLLGAMLRVDVLNVPFPTPGYEIPPGNIFAGNAKCSSGTANSNDCPEIWSWGLRNPWRWSFDEPTGELWLADVGQNAWEEVNIVTGSNNYGWRCREGAHNFNTSGCNLNTLVEPVHEYPHGSGNGSITGGYVYRGTQAPQLQGNYVFADYLSGRIWYLTGSLGTGFTPIQILDTSFNIAAFGYGHDGEVYVLPFSSNAKIYKFNGTVGGLEDNVATSLADTGCVDPSDITQPASGLIPYQPAASFWSDNAVKSRWIALPDGVSINVENNNDWTFPPGTVLVKQFEVESKIVETRLMMRHPDGVWAGYTYEWNDNETAATRIDDGKSRVLTAQNWLYPSQAECDVCHTEIAGYALGPETAQLNSDFTYPSTGITDNQLEVFNHIDLFNIDVPEPVGLNPALADPTDQTANLDDRARAYLHTNCANCHQPNGPTPTSLDLRFDTLLQNTGTCEQVPQAGDLGISGARIIDPSSPATSVLLERISRRDQYAMPPLASEIVDSEGVTLISDWIMSLSSCP